MPTAGPAQNCLLSITDVRRLPLVLVPSIITVDSTEMDLPSLAYQRLRGDAIEVHKYLKGIYKVDSLCWTEDV